MRARVALGAALVLVLLVGPIFAQEEETDASRAARLSSALAVAASFDDLEALTARKAALTAFYAPGPNSGARGNGEDGPSEEVAAALEESKKKNRDLAETFVRDSDFVNSLATMDHLLPPDASGAAPIGGQGRVIDGKIIHGLSGVAFLAIPRPGRLSVHCTAFLVGETTLLTAAHCICGTKPVAVFVESRSVSPGSGEPGETCEPGENITRQARHLAAVRRSGIAIATPEDVERCNGAGSRALSQAGDLALLSLDPAAAPMLRRIGASPLPLAAPQSQPGAVVGYGATRRAFNNGFAFGYESACRRAAPFAKASLTCEGPGGRSNAYGCYQDIEFAAGAYATDENAMRPSSCIKDSGGPYLERRGPDHFVVTGVVSRGIGGDAFAYHLSDISERFGARCGAGSIFTALTKPRREWVKTCVEHLEGGRDASVCGRPATES